MHMKRLLPLLLTLSLTLQAEDYKAAVSEHLAKYPLSHLQDIYKSFYQDFFGAEHMITDTAAVREYMMYELSEAAQDPVQTVWYEPTGSNGRYVRVYLRNVTEGKITAEMLLDAFIRSARPQAITTTTWPEEWRKIAAAAIEIGVPAEEGEAQALEKASSLQRAVRHSAAYREAYHPHYRIIAREIFDNELYTLIAQ